MKENSNLKNNNINLTTDIHRAEQNNKIEKMLYQILKSVKQYIFQIVGYWRMRMTTKEKEERGKMLIKYNN